MRKSTKVALAALLAAALLSQTGCVFRRERIENSPRLSLSTRTSDNSVALDGADNGEVVLMMGAGNLTVAGGAREGKLLDGEFSYAPASLRPVFEPTTLGDTAQVVIRNDREDGLGDFPPFSGARARNEWDIRLTEEVPLRQLSITLGAGDGDIDLSDVDVERLSVNVGAGDSTVDLSGERTHDVEGAIKAGAGAVTIKLPADVGVRIKGVQDGVGDWTTDGFTREGNYVMNESYDTADVRIELNVQRGVGSVRLELVD